jgi:hypothetical protein
MCLAALSAGAQPVDVEIGTDNRSLSLSLPGSAFARDGTQLAVDIDGYDVTAFARIEDRRLVIELDAALAGGEHSLALLAFHADGSDEVLADAVFDIVATGQGEWALNTLLESNYRVQDSSGPDYANTEPLANAGSLAFSAHAARGNRGYGATVEAAYDEANRSVAGVDEWLLPSYELYAGYGGETAAAWAVAGNIGIDRDDLLFSSYQRRGAALETAAGSGRFTFKGFAVGSQPRSGFDGNYLYPSDSNDRSAGLSTALIVAGKHLELGGAYIDGKSRFGGDGFSPQYELPVFGGDTWNVSLDSRWLDDDVWFHLERAGSEFDADGIGFGRRPVRDDAFQASLQVQSGERLGSGPFAYWSAVLRHSSVGRDFYSIGNLSLPGNLEATSAWLQGGFTSVVVDLELAREKTNPDSDPAQASQTLERSGLTIAWSPATVNLETGLFGLLGAPSATAWIYRIDNSQPDDDAMLAGFDVDDVTRETGLSLAFARDALNWSIEYGAIDYDDRSMAVIDNGFVVYEPYSDSRNRYLTLMVGWAPGERFGLEAHLQRNALEELDFGDEYRSSSYGVSGNFVLVPRKLSLVASLTRGEDRARYGDTQFAPDRLESDFASLQVNWRVAQGEGKRPVANLFLKGNYGRNDDSGLPGVADFWAIFLGGSLNWTGSQ